MAALLAFFMFWLRLYLFSVKFFVPLSITRSARLGALYF